jgi:hypothetical protein
MTSRTALVALALAVAGTPASAFEFINAPPPSGLPSLGVSTPLSTDTGKKPYDWSGFYVGATAGTGFGMDSRNIGAPFGSLGSGLQPWSAGSIPPVTFDAVPSLGAGSLGFSQSAPFSRELTAGYNLKLTNNLVVGIEGDMQSFGQASPMPGWLGLQEPSGSAGSVRAKAGYVGDSFQFFVSGGVVTGNRGGFGTLP